MGAGLTGACESQVHLILAIYIRDYVYISTVGQNLL